MWWWGRGAVSRSYLHIQRDWERRNGREMEKVPGSICFVWKSFSVAYLSKWSSCLHSSGVQWTRVYLPVTLLMDMRCLLSQTTRQQRVLLTLFLWALLWEFCCSRDNTENWTSRPLSSVLFPDNVHTHWRSPPPRRQHQFTWTAYFNPSTLSSSASCSNTAPSTAF